MYIDKITIAIEKIIETIVFYKETFNLDLNEIDCGDFEMFVGKLDNIQILFCPKNIAGITATENTVQLRFVVEDIDIVMEKGLQFGGSKLNEIKEQNGVKTSALRDPDGNSIEIIQK